VGNGGEKGPILLTMTGALDRRRKKGLTSGKLTIRTEKARRKPEGGAPASKRFYKKASRQAPQRNEKTKSWGCVKRTDVGAERF